MAIYAVSDLHGHFDVFMDGLKKINLKDDDELYVIGDAIDRGEDGIRILQYIKEHKNMDLLIGNHEFMMLNSVDPNGEDKCNGYDSDLWLYGNGGTKTYAQYERLSTKERQSLLFWMNRRYVIKTLEIDGTPFCLTHSYFRDELKNKTYNELKYDDVWNIVWTSVYREDWETRGYDIYRDHDYTFITGHVPVQRVRYNQGLSDDEANNLKILEKGNLIDIDGGCAAGYHDELNNGALFLRLNDMKAYAVPMPNEKGQEILQNSEDEIRRAENKLKAAKAGIKPVK